MDIYKGIAIILVVIGHLEISDSLYKYIYMFHMYAFFFAAGITFKINKSDTFMQFLKKNISRLYIPYLFFAFMWDITNMLIQVTHGNHYDLSVSALSQNVVAVLIGRGFIYSNASIGPAWFLLCLLVVRIVFWTILKITNKNLLLQFAICAMLFIIGHQLRGKEFMPFFIIQSLTTFIFVFMGYVSKEYCMTLVKYSNTLLLSIVAIISVTFTALLAQHSNCKLLLLNNILPDNILVLIGAALCGITSIICLSILFSKIPLIKTILIWCGVNSLIIMGTHVEIRTAINLLLGNISMCDQLMVIVKSFSILLISIPIVYMLKTYFPILVYGKTK